MNAQQKINQPTVYSRRKPEAVYNRIQREAKARKILSVLSDYLPSPMAQLRVLDVGCSSGIITNFLAPHFQSVAGTDIDRYALAYAERTKAFNAFFVGADALELPFHDESFDVLVCAHVYEHVADSQRLMNEIHRVLKNDGVCFFAAGNRLRLVEPHYGLPMLSVLPRTLADRYLRVFRRGKRYREKHLTYWGLKQLVSRFYLVDYTFKIIQNPEKYSATDLCTSGSVKQRLALLFSRAAYALVPTYIFILKKAEP